MTDAELWTEELERKVADFTPIEEELVRQVRSKRSLAVSTDEKFAFRLYAAHDLKRRGYQ